MRRFILPAAGVVAAVAAAVAPACNFPVVRTCGAQFQFQQSYSVPSVVAVPIVAQIVTAYTPTVRGVVASELPAGAQCGYEIVIDGLTLEAVERATAAGLHAAARPEDGIVAITAGNYGGKLGPFHIRLRDVLGRYPLEAVSSLELDG